MHIDQLSTPALLVDRRQLDYNLARMQDLARTNQVALRPHVKTHKCIALARRQLELGATGITVARVHEAEVFAAAGFDDIRVAYPVVGPDNHARLLALGDKAKISFCVDSRDAARAASDFYLHHGARAQVLVQVDIGYGRCGVRWDEEESAKFVRRVRSMPGLALRGILTHAGHAYRGPAHIAETPARSVARVARQERDRMLDFANSLLAAGVEEVAGDDFEVSIGSTPTMAAFANLERKGMTITEIRPGNYVFNDGIQVALGVATPTDCALTVLATVLSKRREGRGERLFLDCGKKVLTSDRGYGIADYGTLLEDAAEMDPLPGARIDSLSEEHAWVRVDGETPLSVGDRVRVLPNHACVVVASSSAMHLVDGDEVLERLTVDARR